MSQNADEALLTTGEFKYLRPAMPTAPGQPVARLSERLTDQPVPD